MMNTEQIRFKRFSGHFASLLIAGVVSLFSTVALAATNNVVGVYNNWPTTWIPLNGLNDASNGVLAAKAQIDFVGDTTNPAAFYASTNGYVFFRQRVQANTTNQTTFDNSHFVVINIIGTNFGNADATFNGFPDFAFAWDNANNSSLEIHGLEMQVRNDNANGTTWKTTKFEDIDGVSNVKDVNDINGSSRTTDGYVRVINEQSTTNLSLTTLIDFAVKWSYLQEYPKINSNQTWNVTFASIVSGNDHSFLDGDIAGNASPDSLITDGWISLVTTPTGLAIPPQGSYFSFE